MSALLAIMMIAARVAAPPDTIVKARDSSADRLLIYGRFAQAAAQFQAAYDAAKRAGEEAKIADAAASLGSIYISVDRFGEAEPLLKQAIEIDRRLFGPDAPQTARHAVALAKLYSMQQRLKEAEELLTHAQPIVERAFGKDGSLMATVWNDLGLIEEGFGHTKSATAHYRHAIANYQKQGESRIGPMAMVMVNLAGVLVDEFQLEEASQVAETALTLSERAFGADHPFTARAMHSLGRVRQAQGRLDDARALYERALVKGDFIGVLEAASVQASLGSAYTALGFYPKAEALLKEALAKRERVLGADSLELVGVLNNLGVLYADQGRTTEAMHILERGIAIADRAQASPALEVPILSNLAAAYYKEGRYRKERYAQSEAMLRRVLGLQESRLGPDHIQVARVLEYTAATCAAQKHYREARQLEGRALAIRQAVLGPQHPDTILAQKQYSLLLRKGE